MKVTVTIDTERLPKFGGENESIGDFFARMEDDALRGGKVVWTRTVANVGTIDKVEA